MEKWFVDDDTRASPEVYLTRSRDSIELLSPWASSDISGSGGFYALYKFEIGGWEFSSMSAVDGRLLFGDSLCDARGRRGAAAGARDGVRRGAAYCRRRKRGHRRFCFYRSKRPFHHRRPKGSAQGSRGRHSRGSDWKDSYADDHRRP